MLKRSILSFLFLYLIALLWLYTGVYKLLQLDNSIDQLAESPLISDWSVPLAYGLPVIELALFVLLLIPRTEKIALYGTLVLLSVFSIYIIIILNFHRADTPCICGGIISKLGWKEHVYFNVLFILMALYVLVEPHLKTRLNRRRSLTA